MKTKIYIVTFTSYTESDNYLHNDAQTFTNRLFAQDYYEKLCDNARENANELYVETNDGDGEDWSDTVQGEHHNEDKNNRRYTISREPGTEFGYQVEVKLQEVEIDVPRAIETAHKVGDEIVWEKYGEDHKGRVTDIDLFISTDKGEHYQHAVYRTTESETGERWYVNEEDIIE
ncbi:MAG: hypothetical protein IJV28_07185 [Paludibacteraceae bacterium]|nr:hypothetical protein [Paludibacteraceae bacterium]